jgi:murein DD-endopeptidase MepM/ murein hydrolase activator NlpD
VLDVRGAADPVGSMRRALWPVATTSAAALALPAAALAGPGGGAVAPTLTGGVASDAPAHPVATLLRVAPAVVTSPALPRIAVRVALDEPGRVVTRVVVRPRRGRAVALDLGHVRPGRTVVARWRRGTRLRPGRYGVRVEARGPSGLGLARPRRAPGRATLTVRAPAPPPAPAPDPTGVFPVAGPHTYGDPFGAPRNGYAHQGQDLLAAEGTAVVAPVAGTVSTVGDQPSAAGVYVVEKGGEGHDFLFAHCQAGSVRVAVGQAMVAGTPLCAVGHTGDASGPHLHFEVWVGGWRGGPASAPIDPLALLRAWEP